MKSLKTFFMGSLMILIPLISKAEDGDRVGGIRFGYHTANLFLDGSKEGGANNLTGFYFGFSRDNKLAPIIHLNTGLEYFQNGSKVNDDNKIVYHTISIPVTGKVKLGPVFAQAGFGANLKVAERVHIQGTSTTPDQDNRAKWFDVPFIVGGGVKILFISVEARYHWGLVDIDNGFHNQYFQLGASLTF